MNNGFETIYTVSSFGNTGCSTVKVYLGLQESTEKPQYFTKTQILIFGVWLYTYISIDCKIEKPNDFLLKNLTIYYFLLYLQQ